MNKPTNTKECGNCEVTLELSSFWRDRSKKDGRHTICINCQTIAKQGRREQVNETARKYRRNNQARFLWYSAKQRATAGNYPFNISIKDVVVPDVCPVFGVPLEVSPTGRQTDNSATLDKVIPELGYVKGNIAVMSLRANRLKQNATVAEIRKLADWLEAFLGSP